MAGQAPLSKPGDVPPPAQGPVGRPGAAPKDLRIGAINPRALTELILGRKVDWKDPSSTKLMTETLETPYNELFDLKYNSPIYAGLKLGPNNTAVPLGPDELKVMTDQDRLTPNLGAIKTIGDLKTMGLDDVNTTQVNQAFLTGGKLNLVLDAPVKLNKTIGNTSVTRRIFDIATPFGTKATGKDAGYTPPGYSWRQIGEMLSHATDYDDPIQGSVGNCWLIAAMAAVAWADPYSIVSRVRPMDENEHDRMNAIQFYSVPSSHNAPTMRVELTPKTLVDSYGGWIPYCRCSDEGEIWPEVYEKAFAKWASQDPTDEPDITSTAYGDPGAALAQLNGKTPYWYYTWDNSPDQLWGIVRENSVAFKTVNPMTAWTFGSGDQYNGSNIVANHAYTILGWAWNNGKQYIVLRNPWGFDEPAGLNTYQGMLIFFDSSFWHYINMVGDDGVFALEAEFFKVYFAGMAVSK